MANKIIIIAKQVRHVEVEVSTSEGFDVPDDAIDFAEFYADLKANPSDAISHVDWDDADEINTEIVSVKIKR